jgi:hypothetical protein
MKGYAEFKGYKTILVFNAEERSFVTVKVEYPAPFGSGGPETQPERTARAFQELPETRARPPLGRARNTVTSSSA